MLSETDTVIMAEEARAALFELAHISGYVGLETILDVVFSDFCIGK